jgi:DNA repair exonuclease SbcCD ATPase subunit
MILFKKIRYRNFLSTGNHFNEIDFTEHRTNLLIGTNGSGKSSLLDALCFSLYGKAYRKINKNQLINSINEKDCRVEVEFSIGNTEWKIIRGIKPNLFEIQKDGKSLDQSAVLEQQKWLEQNVLKMDFKSFTQIVILGSSNYIPFMQLQSAHRREVIEDLLDIKIFSSMNIVIKEKIRKIKDEIKTLDLKKESLSDKVKMQNNFIDELEKREKENIQNKKQIISSLNQEIKNLLNGNKIIETNIVDIQKNIDEYANSTDKLKKLVNLKGKLSEKISIIAEEHKFFSTNTVCPTCTQSINEEFRLNKIDNYQNKAKELQSGYQDLKLTIQEEESKENKFLTLSKELVKFNNEIIQNHTSVSIKQKQIQDIQYEIQTIAEQIENKNIEHVKLKEFEDNLQRIYEDLASKKDLIHYYDFTYNLLKDGGVKSKIIKKYLPLINQQVNRYLQMMDFYVNFTLDEEFNEEIKSPIQEDFSYSSFSEGEKSRINLALIFAWREIAKFKNSTNCNIILFDEVFDSSLDSAGSDDFLKIIKYILKDTNVFVISHKIGLEDKFDGVYQAEKIKGFSKLVKI